METLETTSKRTDESKIELTVSFSADDVQKRIDAVYKEAGKARIPGFRPGKAPRRVLENHYGGKAYFLAQATDELVTDSLPLAIDQEGLVPLDKPEIGGLDLVEEGKAFSYVATFTVRPLLELTSYDPVQIELPSEEPTPDEIEEQIDVMLQYYYDFEEVTGRPVQEKDFVTLELSVSADGEQVTPMTGDSIPYELNTGIMPKSFDDQLIGMEIGETKEFDFGLTPNEGTWMSNATQSHAVATVKEIKAKARPELTDEWVKEKIEFDSVQDFRDRIADSLKARKLQEIASLREQLAAEELASRLIGEPPSLLITQTEQEMYRDFFSQLQRNNQTFDTFLASADMSADKFRENIKKQATEVTAQALAFDALARHLGFEVTDEEIREEFKSSGADDPEALYQRWAENGRISEVRDGLLRIKASQHTDDSAVVFEVGKKPVAKKAAKKTDKPEKVEKDEKPEKGDRKVAAKKPDAEKTASKKAKSDSKSTEKEPSDKKTVTKKQNKAEKADTES